MNDVRSMLLRARRWRGGVHRLALLVVPTITLWALAAGSASAQQLELSVRDRQIYAGLPFTMSVVASGFDEEPQPTLTELRVPGATVRFVGVEPRVSQMVSIINGRRSETRDVTFAFQYLVEAPNPGRYEVQSISATQGLKTAVTSPATFQVQTLALTDDMRLRITLPQRPLWVGERFEVTIDWLLRRDVRNVQSFIIPLLLEKELFDVEPVVEAGREFLEFDAGDEKLKLPYERGQEVIDGGSFTRFRFKVFVTPKQPGRRTLPAAQVVAELQTGTQRDRFGFAVAGGQLFRAVGESVGIDVRPLPLTGRPASFANAVGSAFAIAVEADRTVVKVGDPIELSVHIRGDGNLAGLMLPRLNVDGGLAADLFSVPGTPPAGQDDGEGGKLFRVSVRVKSDRVTEIPPLAFAFFDPARGVFQTVRSQPIALSVAGAKMIGAADVQSAAPDDSRPSSRADAARPTRAEQRDGGSLVGADLGMSNPAHALRRALVVSDVTVVLVLLYVCPLLFVGWLSWRRRTHADRATRDASKAVRRSLEQAIQEARKSPARETAPGLTNHLRALAKALGKPPSEFDGLLAKVDATAYDPRAADRPLAASLVDEIEALAAAWHPDSTTTSLGSSVAMLFCVGLALFGAEPARAEPLDEARDAYQQALSVEEREARTANFMRAENLLRALAEEHPHSPELLVDWGNAALGAQDLGHAVLAYRRALALDARNERAERNLEWVRSALPADLPRPDEGAGAVHALFFWGSIMSRAWLAIFGACAFAVGVLLLAPWRQGPMLRRTLRLLAVGPFVLWVWLTAAIWVAVDPSMQAVVVGESVTLRSADSAGAAAVLDEPLPAGAEVSIDELRADWVRVELADGRQGWVPSNTVARVGGP